MCNSVEIWCSRKQVTLKARHITGRVNVEADKLSTLDHTIQTEWSLFLEVFQLICSRWHQPQIDLFATRFSNKLSLFVSPVPDPLGLGSGGTQPTMGRSGCTCLPTSSHLMQSGGEAAGLPMQENLCDCSRVAQYALVLGSSGSSQIPLSLPNLLNLLTRPFSQTPHRNLPNLNLNAWLLEPQLSKNRASLRQWRHELRILKEDQPVQSMRQSGPFLQSGASVTRMTLGHPL